MSTRFESGEVDEVVLVYSEFISTMTQTVRATCSCCPSRRETAMTARTMRGFPLPYEIEPSAGEAPPTLVPEGVEVEIFRALLENQAGEQAARMAAMEAATRNTRRS